MLKPIYNAKGWVLCTCHACGLLNYVEPHGTDAKCAHCKRTTDHLSVPDEHTAMGRTLVICNRGRLVHVRK
jgi:hypothetical protein